jgi:Xaa-Pro aminopeptidase
MGAQSGGYASDMTRVVAVGKAAKNVHKIYSAVLESQLAALDAVHPGASAAHVDAAARMVLRKHGLDRFFVHATGHGLGLEIHEAPRLARKERTVLEAGMVITIEPGVYIEGSVGIRIEDTVAVTNNGARILTPTTKELVCL